MLSITPDSLSSRAAAMQLELQKFWLGLPMRNESIITPNESSVESKSGVRAQVASQLGYEDEECC